MFGASRSGFCSSPFKPSSFLNQLWQSLKDTKTTPKMLGVPKTKSVQVTLRPQLVVSIGGWGDLNPSSRSPSSALLPVFGEESLILTSLLEDLVFVTRKPTGSPKSAHFRGVLKLCPCRRPGPGLANRRSARARSRGDVALQGRHRRIRSFGLRCRADVRFFETGLPEGSLNDTFSPIDKAMFRCIM